MIEIKVQQNALAAALTIVTKASKSSGFTPAFELVRLEAEANRLNLTCFNGEFAARGSMPAQCLDISSTCVNAATLRDVVQTMDGEITLRITDDELRLESGPNRAYLRMNVEALPLVEPQETGDVIPFSGKDLKKLAAVALFASADSTRAALQGVHLMVSRDETSRTVLQAQAADGFCLGRIHILTEREPAPTEKGALVMPAVFLRMLAGVVEDEDQVFLQMHPLGKQVAFQVRAEDRDFLFVSALLEDAFPVSAVEDLLAKASSGSGAQLALQPAALERVIRQVNAMGTKCMFLKVKAGLTRVASEETEFGQARNVLPGEVTGGEAQVWVNTDLMLKLTRSCTGGMAVKIGKATDPLLVKSGDLVALVMPLHNLTDPFEGEEELPIPLALDQAAPLPA
jgi:DNA polymerase III sliding clamp (beta) subunit (PCNA family)